MPLNSSQYRSKKILISLSVPKAVEVDKWCQENLGYCKSFPAPGGDMWWYVFREIKDMVAFKMVHGGEVEEVYRWM